MKTKALIFLNGHYPEKHKGFYINEFNNGLAESEVIAVDGALKFFDDNGINPSVVIGDGDSISPSLRRKFSGIWAKSAPLQNENFTDGELSLIRCMENNIRDITIYGGIDANFETDHLLGNIFMMFAYADKFESIKMRDPHQEIYPLVNASFSGEGRLGDKLSIIPLSESILFSATGLKYDPGGRAYGFGGTMPLRNQLINKNFTIRIEGKAVLVKHFQLDS